METLFLLAAAAAGLWFWTNKDSSKAPPPGPADPNKMKVNVQLPGQDWLKVVTVNPKASPKDIQAAYTVMENAATYINATSPLNMDEWEKQIQSIQNTVEKISLPNEPNYAALVADINTVHKTVDGYGSGKLVDRGDALDGIQRWEQWLLAIPQSAT